MERVTHTIAAIVPTFRRGRYLIGTLESLFEQTVPPDEILVIDQSHLNDYAPSEREWLERAAAAGKFRWIQQSEPAVSKARNRAISESGSDILLYLDDDITASEQLIANHLWHYTDPDVQAVVGGGTIPGVDKLVPVPADFARHSRVEQAFRATCFDRPMCRVSFIWAGNFSIRRQALLGVGGWDEHIINYGDKDLGLRLAQMGLRIDYDPEARFIHHVASSGGTRITDSKSPFRGWRRCVSIWYLAFRHLSGSAFLRYGVFRAARFSFLLRASVARPWKIPGEIIAFLWGGVMGFLWARHGVKSPFVRSLNSAHKEFPPLGA